MTKFKDLPLFQQKQLLAIMDTDIKLHKELLEDATEAKKTIEDRITFLEGVRNNIHSIENFVSLLQRGKEIRICVIRIE